MLKSKQKYVIGMATAAILFTSPLTSAAEDEDIVIFGDNLEPVRTETTKPSETSKPVVVEEPSETSEPFVVENPASNIEENENNQEIEVKETDNYSEDENQNSNDDENNSENNTPIDKIDANPAVNNLNNGNSSNDNENDDYDVGENIKFSTEKPASKNVIVTKVDDFNNSDDINNNSYNNLNENNNKYDSNFKNYSNNVKNSNNNVTIRKSSNVSRNNNSQNGEQQVIKARFIKLLSDDNYDYYLDRHSVNWVKIPYFANEYMADVWIRMLKRTQNEEEMSSDLYNYTYEINDEVSEAAAKGKIYNEVDVKVLRTKKYFLEHYYLRPKTKQIQILCTLDIVGRPQNSLKDDKPYDYKNWENLVPGSVEFAIYYGVISDIGTSKATTRGHRTFIDMLDEYARIALN